MANWANITIVLMHYVPRSKGARVSVVSGDRHIVSSASYEGMTVAAPHIQSFLTWVREYYDGAAFREITEEEARSWETEPPAKKKRGRPRKTSA
jgi:hypothetical protein